MLRMYNKIGRKEGASALLLVLPVHWHHPAGSQDQKFAVDFGRGHWLIAAPGSLQKAYIDMEVL